MPISTTLQSRYRSEVDVDWWEALIISHSLFGTYYLANAQDGKMRRGVVDGKTQTFIAVPFEVILPSRDGEGGQDMSLAICNVGAEMMGALEKAIEDPTEAIRCRYTVYIEGNTTPQRDPPFELSLTDISANEQQVNATATNARIWNIPFPSVVYRGEQWPGLIRR